MDDSVSLGGSTYNVERESYSGQRTVSTGSDKNTAMINWLVRSETTKKGSPGRQFEVGTYVENKLTEVGEMT